MRMCCCVCACESGGKQGQWGNILLFYWCSLALKWLQLLFFSLVLSCPTSIMIIFTLCVWCRHCLILKLTFIALCYHIWNDKKERFILLFPSMFQFLYWDNEVRVEQTYCVQFDPIDFGSPRWHKMGGQSQQWRTMKWKNGGTQHVICV